VIKNENEKRKGREKTPICTPKEPPKMIRKK
jgi:hypothetical protein